MFGRPHTDPNAGGSIVNSSGAFTLKVHGGLSYTAMAMGSTYPNSDVINFNANLSNSTYGNSNEVEPSAVKGFWQIKAFGSVSNLGNVDLSDVAKQIEVTEANILKMKADIESFSFGINQDWVDVTSERFKGVTYKNTSNKPIFISVNVGNAKTTTLQLIARLDGKPSPGIYMRLGEINQYNRAYYTTIVPSGVSYSLDWSVDGMEIISWWEFK